MIPRLHKISDEALLQVFSSSYEQISGLPIPEHYLMTRTVYGFFYRKRLVGGFIIGVNTPFRTIEVFSNHPHQQILHQLIEGIAFSEICSFWLEKTYRKKLLSYWLWMWMAWIIYSLKSQYLLFGTNSKGLARIYNYPRKCFLLHEDKVLTHSGLKDTWIFVGRRKDIIMGVLEIFILKLLNISLLNKEKFSVFEEIVQRRNQIKYAIHS